jgi:RNA 2',3'-cyclic 3'-phosphodiesterase
MFVAVWPDDAARRRLSLLGLEPAPGLRLVRDAQLHVTLRFLGDVDEDLVPTLVEALGAAVAHVGGRVHCEIGPATAWFSGRRVLQIPVTGLDALAAAVRTATLPIVPETNPNEPPFTGHLTVARANRRRLQPSTGAVVSGLRCAASFEVQCVDLVASQLSADGPRYTTLEHVPLPG